jgi:hypothetical protein
MEPKNQSRVAFASRVAQLSSAGKSLWAWLRDFFSWQNLFKDLRSAVVSSFVGAATALLTAWLISPANLSFTVGVNSSGIGRPKALFDTAQKEEPKLKLNFFPPELRDTYVCEFKRLNGTDWKKMVLDYLDAYRDCFDVSAQGENTFSVYPNWRSSVLIKRSGAYLCKCSGHIGAR